jgi:hypothetical protein
MAIGIEKRTEHTLITLVRLPHISHLHTRIFAADAYRATMKLQTRSCVILSHINADPTVASASRVCRAGVLRPANLTRMPPTMTTQCARDLFGTPSTQILAMRMTMSHRNFLMAQDVSLASRQPLMCSFGGSRDLQ